MPPAVPRLGLLLLLSLAFSACEALPDAPEGELDRVAGCPPLEAYAPQTVALLESGRLPELRRAFSEELDPGTQRTVLRLVFGLLDVFPPSALESLAPLEASPQVAAIIDLGAGLLGGLERLPQPVADALAGGVQRWSQVCPMEPPLVLLDRLLAASETTLRGLARLLGGALRLIEPSSLSHQTWLDLLDPILEILATAATRPESVQHLILLVAALPGLEDAAAAATLLEDPELTAALARTADCLVRTDRAQGSAVLSGVAALLASGALPLGSLETALAPSPETRAAVSPIRQLLQGLAEDPDSLEALRLALAWILAPARARRVLPELRLLLTQPIVSELLGLAVRVGAADCAVPPPAAQ